MVRKTVLGKRAIGSLFRGHLAECNEVLVEENKLIIDAISANDVMMQYLEGSTTTYNLKHCLNPGHLGSRCMCHGALGLAGSEF